MDEILEQLRDVSPNVNPHVVGAAGRLVRAARLLEQGFREKMAELDADPWEFDVLDSLRRAGPPFRLTAGALLRSMMVSPGALTNRVDRLVAKGVVTREVDPGNRRQVLISLTDQGFQLAEHLGRTLHGHNRDAFAALSEDEIITLGATLRKLLLALGDTPESRGFPKRNAEVAA